MPICVSHMENYLVFYMDRYLCYPVLDIWRNLCPPVLVIWNPIYYLVFYMDRYLCYPVLGIWRNLCPSGTLYTTLSLTYTSTCARHMEASIYYTAFNLYMNPGHIVTLPIQYTGHYECLWTNCNQTVMCQKR